MVYRRGFTVVELLIVIVVIGILAAITIVSYNGVQRRAADGVTRTTVADAYKILQSYYTFNRNYPSNIADTEYIAPSNVAVTLRTNTATKPVYQGLTDDQNAQLFLNSCNAFMPVVDSGTTYNTGCAFAGRDKIHVKGQVGTNKFFYSPISQSAVTLDCTAAVCTSAQQKIVQTFLDQGGRFPVIVSKSGSTLPKPTLVTTGDASDYCLQAYAVDYPDAAYHVTPTSDQPQPGVCPANPALTYP